MLVHVAVAFAGLVAFSALTIDLGVLWAARRQAQNSADGAALAGAVSLAYVDPDDAGVAADAARTVAAENAIWGEAPVNPDVAVGPCPTGAPAAPGQCVRVEVGRTTDTGSPLPIYIARMFGLGSQNVRAVGTAQVLTGNSSSCLRPLAIADRWNDTYDVTDPIDLSWTPEDLFERYADAGVIPPDTADTYVPPTASSPGSGFTVTEMSGTRVRLTRPTLNFHGGVLVARNYVQLDLPRAAGSVGDEEANYRENFASCNGLPVSIGDWKDAYDNHWDATNLSVQALIDADPAAVFDASTGTIQGSAFRVSPRLITVGVFDPDAYAQAARPSARISVHIRNMVGFFLEQVEGSGNITGVIMSQAGRFDPAGDSVTDTAAFLRSVALVR